MLQQTTLRFLKDLKKNNNKQWFDANRQQYEAARSDFASFIQSVIQQYGKKDPSIRHLLAKDCMFRINRDVRFSKDKSPYKTNFGASINLGGKKAEHTAGYYFHLEPGNSFAGGGIWMPSKEYLQKIRQEIDYNLVPFKKIINGTKFKKVYGGLSAGKEYSLTRVPKGYEADNPAAEFLKMKSYVAMKSLDDSLLLSKDIIKTTVEIFEALQPLVVFINNSMQE